MKTIDKNTVIKDFEDTINDLDEIIDGTNEYKHTMTFPVNIHYEGLSMGLVLASAKFSDLLQRIKNLPEYEK